MTDSSTQEKDRRDHEAAHWCTLMHGEEADQHRPAFETWLRDDPRNLASYNGMEEIYLLGRNLKNETVRAAPLSRDATPHKQRHLLLARLVILATAFLIAQALRPKREPEPISAGARQSASIEGPDGVLSSTKSPRTVTLSDGSKVTLDSDSVLKIAFSADQRLLMLQRGGGLFEVAHEKRPFVVSAGGGSVTAKGTIFHVAISRARKVQVDLIRGRIDVDLPGSIPAPSGAEQTRHLEPGEQVRFDAAPIHAAISVDDRTSAQTNPIPRTVGELVSAANVTSAREQIILGDTELASLRISGAFQIHDPVTVAEQLAIIFDLVIDRSRTGALILRRPR